MTTHLVVGAGPIGSTLALYLAGRGDHVRLLTRSGSGPDHPGIERRAGDASDTAELRSALDGAAAVHWCLHASRYRADTWRAELPSLEAGVLRAASFVGIPVIFAESLYALDAGEQPFTSASPIAPGSAKGEVRVDLLRARRQAPVRTVSIAASDYFGPFARANAHAGERMIMPILRGRTVRPLGSADQPHSFTYLPDLAAAMAQAADIPTLDGLVMAPTAPPVTQRELVEEYARAAGVPVPAIRPLPSRLLRWAGRVHRDSAELAEMLHQWERPYVMDSRADENRLGVAPTPPEEAATATIAWWRETVTRA
ncbi:NAD-dependent epimerase/dehydratase family protein [Aeromicrobium sp. PE09-221]|uniref:NAD-dependent epimerase/dehydratase family protein n=1 Tax=Aeromicrobium sp. PE09-221 TaxID=1898043 RepID=UPI00191C7313|nr:NAD-dependent epimerase/dehydratase family protein [Aeromicrobium sp. PE09-221]